LCACLFVQAADINALFGFRIECIERLGDPHGIWAWTRLNSLFNWLPLAALIEDKILCMHGGAAVGRGQTGTVYLSRQHAARRSLEGARHAAYIFI
jgi:hypothetical protein